MKISGLRFLRDNPSVKVVIIAGYWSYQASGISYHFKPTIFRDEEYDGSGLNYDRISFQHALQKLVGAFPDRRFIIIDDVPVGPELEILRSKRALHVQRILRWIKSERLSASFGLSRPLDVLCDGEFCRARWRAAFPRRRSPLLGGLRPLFLGSAARFET